MTSIKALIWKEWRECRTFVIIAIMLMLLVRIVLPCLPYIFPDVRRDDWGFSKYFIGGLIFPIISLFVVLFSSFYYELKNNTVSFLLIKPVSTAKIFWVKYFSGLLILFILILLSFGIFGLYSSDFFKSPQGIFRGFLGLLFIYSYVFAGTLLPNIKGKGKINLLLSFSGLLLIFVSIPHITASVIFITFDLRETFIVLLIIFTAISLFTGYTIWQKKVSKDASPVVLLAIVSITLSIFSVLFFLTLDIYAGWKLCRVTREAEIAGLKVNVEHLNKLTDEEKKSDDLYQRAFALEKKIYANYFTGKNGKPPEELLFNDPDYKELSDTVDEIVAIPHRRFSISFDEYGFCKESRELSRFPSIFKLHVEPLLADKKYDEVISLCQKISKLFDGAPGKPVYYMHASLSGSENGIAGIILKVPSDGKYLEQFRFFLSRLDKTSMELPEKMIQDSVSDYYDRINKYLTGQYQRGSLPGINNRIFEYLLIDYFGKPCNKKVLYMNLVSSIRQSHLFRIDDLEEILKIVDEDNRKFQGHLFFPFLNIYDLSIYRYKIYVDLNRQAFALKIYKAEHGSYPEKLEEIVPGILPKLSTDYFSGKNFVYRRNGEGFILYSIGQNKKDDGGLNLGKNTKGKDDITCVCEN
ncbi:MAG: hypothetical protein WCS96_03715 [Victivallales bacterium]